MKAVIMAGGFGSRVASIAGGVPKPLLPIGGVPVLERTVRVLREQGLYELILTVGHRREAIMAYFGDGSGRSPATGESFGVSVQYFIEEEPLGNAGALFRLQDKLTEDFLLLNADAVFDVDLSRFFSFHRARGGLATLFTHPNSHPYDSALIETAADGSVTQWFNKEEPRPTWYQNRVNAGLHILSPMLLDRVVEKGDLPERVDLDRNLLKPLAGTGALFAYDSSEYIRDMGTPERYTAVEQDVAAGIVTAKNLRNEQRAIFLDRDGTINRYVGFLRDIDEFILLPGVAGAIRRINESGYLAIVVTNQPVVARGEVTEDELDMIHRKMETLLGEEGAYLDAIYICPHHPDHGFAGERPELKIDCECRKPKPGMLMRAAREHHVNLAASWMIGDGLRDVEAGFAAGCRVAYIGEDTKDLPEGATCYPDLLSAVRGILG